MQRVAAGASFFSIPTRKQNVKSVLTAKDFAFLPVEDGASGYCADGQQMAKSCWYKPGDLSYCAKYPSGLNVGETMHLPSILAKIPPSQSGTISWRVSYLSKRQAGSLRQTGVQRSTF